MAREKRGSLGDLVDEYEDEAYEEYINCTTPQPTQESQFEYASSNSYFLVTKDDDEDHRLRPRSISEKIFSKKIQKETKSTITN